MLIVIDGILIRVTHCMHTISLSYHNRLTFCSLLIFQKQPKHERYRNGGPPSLAEMHVMFDDHHITGAEFAIFREIPLDKEAFTIDEQWI